MSKSEPDLEGILKEANPVVRDPGPDVNPDKSRRTTKTLIADPNDRPYSIADLTVLHNLSRWTVTRLYENETGVLVLEAPAGQRRKRGRRYRTIRVPRNVYLRVGRRLENR